MPTPITNLRIIFMGTPAFAVPSLDVLVENGLNVVAVVTAPDKPAGRGRKLTASPVKEAALKHGLPLLQPANLKSPGFLKELKSYQANLQVVVAFRMLPVAVWDMPEIGTFNLHASLLPQYRGAAPINWAIINGETETGVTTFFLKHAIDTGDILFQEKEEILVEDTMGTLYERLMKKGAGLVLKTVKAIGSGNSSPVPQKSEGPIKEAPKIFKETCQIDFAKTAQEVYNFVRGLSPYPAAWTELDGKNCKLFTVKPLSEQLKNEMETDGRTFLKLRTADGAIEVLDLQLQGKKRMPVDEFLRGHRFENLGD